MLADERFSDRPRCADPVLGAFLRAFNDRLDHVRRQALRPYAAYVVATRGPRAVTRARRDRCLAFAGGGWLARLRVLVLLGVRDALRLNEGAAALAVRTAVARGDEDAGFDLLDALLADGGVTPHAGMPVSPSGHRNAPAPAVTAGAS